jgi:hypothetical protein
MKTMTTLISVAALIAGMSIAVAQNQGGSAEPGASPSNINKGSDDTTRASSQSGNESKDTAMQRTGANKSVNATGSGKFCIEVSKGGGSVQCKYASVTACEKDAQVQGLQCSPNPNLGTTGAR